jgi:hypothetical protein
VLLSAKAKEGIMSIWTLLFLLAVVAMIAMHLRGHGHGGHGHGAGHRHDDAREDHDDIHGGDPTAPHTQPAEDATQPVGSAEPHGGHGAHRRGC